MPTFSSIDLPPPRNWQDFEDLCCDLWRRLWNDPEAQKHGRSGQPQSGVDIVGRPHGGAERVGLQCKHRGPRIPLTRTEIEREVELARTFKPPLSKLLIATTAPSDIAVQRMAREITEQQRMQGAFSVTIVSWDDILLHLAGYPDLVAKHYPDLALAFQTSPPAMPSEEALLELWLREVAADHQQLTPYFQRQPELDLLQRVYVELQLTTPIEGSGVSGCFALGAPAELREVLNLKPDDNPWVTRRWVVLGDPGAGKTTLLRHFTASLAMERTRSWVPLFHSLPQLLRTQDFILDPVGIRMERLGYSGERLKALLDRCGREGRLVLLLDGLDEVPRERCEEAEQILRGLADRWPKIPLVVTSRPIGYRRPGPDFRELVLLPLDRARQRDFLARWLGRATGEPDAVKAAQALTSLDSPHLRELAGNPLYLTLMALLWESGIEPDRNRTRLYDQVFALLFEGRHHGSRREPLEAQETVRAVLRRLAYEMTVENLEAEPVTALEERLRSPKLDGLRITLERVAGWSRMRQFLDDIAQRTGILGPHDGPAADWRFWHRTFREALTAEQLAEDYREERAKHGILSRFRSIEATLAARAQCVKTEEDLSNWAEPFALLVGQVDNPDQLVRSLVRKNRLLGLRAMATAQNLSDDTLRQILALTDKWKQRCKVLRAIPELVAEPRRALALLDRLRRQTRNGNDLFFLDQAVQEVARCAPENAREASDIRAGFYAHIPPPPEDLFLWIDTPIDGRVPLWRELPAGRFRMGSPEGEGHSSEHPCHEVVIAQPFRLGAGPVTVAQYMAFDPKRRFHNWERVADEELPNSPAIGITWYEAVSFCRWLASAWTWARGARLPIEEEWEYACRADTESRYWSGEDEEDLERVGWYRNNSGRRKSWRDYTGNPALDFSEPTTDHRTHRVGEKPANPWGLYDLHGNVQEWTVSPWTESYEECKREKIVNPATIDFEEAIREVPSDGRRVMRGGSSWNAADLVRAAYRFQRDPGDESLAQGFRVVLPAK